MSSIDNDVNESLYDDDTNPLIARSAYSQGENNHNNANLTATTHKEKDVNFTSSQTPYWKLRILRFLDTIESCFQRHSSFPTRGSTVPSVSKCYNLCVRTYTYFVLGSFNKTFQNRKITPKRVFLFSLLLILIIPIFDSIFKKSKPRNYALAKYQSYNFFQDVTNDEWKRMNAKFRAVKPHKFADLNAFIDEPNAWYHYNWNQDFTCSNAQKVGHSSDSNENLQESIGAHTGWLGDGPKWVCDPERIVEVVIDRTKLYRKKWRKKNLQDVGCLIYSIGVNGQGIEFEYGIQTLLSNIAHQKYSKHDKDQRKYPFCEIHVFDPASWHERLSEMPSGIHYHNWGIKGSASSKQNEESQKGHIENEEKFKTFQETVEELGHVGRTLDIMKVDCKLCEWDTYPDYFASSGIKYIHQLLIEVHGTPEQYVNKFFDKMREENYVIFHKDPNTQDFGGTCQDYSFLKLRPEFFEL